MPEQQVAMVRERASTSDGRSSRDTRSAAAHTPMRTTRGFVARSPGLPGRSGTPIEFGQMPGRSKTSPVFNLAQPAKPKAARRKYTVERF